MSGCLRSGSRFSHLSSGDSRFIVCNAQCPFLKDGLKWISGFGFGRVHSYRSHNLLAIYRLKSVKTVNDSCQESGCFGPHPSVSISSIVATLCPRTLRLARNPPWRNVCGASAVYIPRSLSLPPLRHSQPSLSRPHPPSRSLREGIFLFSSSVPWHTCHLAAAPLGAPHGSPRRTHHPTHPSPAVLPCWLGELTCHEPGCAHHDGPAGSWPLSFLPSPAVLTTMARRARGHTHPSLRYIRAWLA